MIILGVSVSVARRAHNVGKLVFTTVKAEFQKKSENSAVSLPWKLQTVSASIDLMVWTAALQEEQGTSSKLYYSICLWTSIIILLIEKLGWFIPSLILELILFNKLTFGFHASVLLSIMISFVMFIVNHKAIAEWILQTTSTNVITKVIVSNRADTLKSEVSLFFTMIINNKLSTCQLSLAVPTFAYQVTCMAT